MKIFEIYKKESRDYIEIMKNSIQDTRTYNDGHTERPRLKHGNT